VVLVPIFAYILFFPIIQIMRTTNSRFEISGWACAFGMLISNCCSSGFLISRQRST